MKGINIHTSILEYKQAYQSIGISDPPTYRLTCSEHKYLAKYCTPFILKTSTENGEFKVEEVKPTSMIAEYYGVRIEVVMLVDPYL